MVLDLSINIGNILTMALFVFGGLGFIYSMKAMITTLDLRLINVEKSNIAQNEELKKLTQVLITLGRYEERFLRLEGMIDDLRHGRGFIEPERAAMR